MSTSNQNFFKKNHYKNGKRHSKKGHNKLTRESENQIFNIIVGNSQKAPVYVHQNEQEDYYYSPKRKYSSKRKTSSNLPTANNSKIQTPKSSIDITNEVQSQLNNLENGNLQKMVTEKLSKRKWSRDSSGYDSMSNDEYYVPQNSNSGFKSKADDFKIKYKTELCKYYEINGTCKFGDNCAYAHGKENLRSKVTKTSAYRTKKCKQFFENGFCPYGNRCQFAHALQSNIINNPYERNMSYKKAIQILAKVENLENIKTMTPKPRLSIFSSIAKPDDVIQSTLFDDIKNLVNDPFFTEQGNQSIVTKTSSSKGTSPLKCANSCMSYKDKYTTDIIIEDNKDREYDLLTASEEE